MVAWYRHDASRSRLLSLSSCATGGRVAVAVVVVVVVRYFAVLVGGLLVGGALGGGLLLVWVLNGAADSAAVPGLVVTIVSGLVLRLPLLLFVPRRVMESVVIALAVLGLVAAWSGFYVGQDLDSAGEELCSQEPF